MIHIVREDGYIAGYFPGVSVPTLVDRALSYRLKQYEFCTRRRRQVPTSRLEPLYSQQPCVMHDGTAGIQIVTMPGLYDLLIEAVGGAKHEVHDNRTPPPLLLPDRGFEGLWPDQKKVLTELLMAGGGICGCPTGYGKTHVMAALVRSYSRESMIARGTPLTVITCGDCDINEKNWRELQELLPGRKVGLVQTGSRRFSTDVQVVGLKSLRHVDPDLVGLLIVDEVHAAGAPKTAGDLGIFRKAVRYGMSATPEGRSDGGDKVITGVVGPVAAERDFQYCVEQGILVPIQICWVPLPLPDGLTPGAILAMKHDAHARDEAAYDNNEVLAQTVLGIMDRISEDEQALAIMKHTSQLNTLRKLRPELEVVHGATTRRSMKSHLRHVPPISKKQRRMLYHLVRTEQVKRVASTYVYKQGVDFPGLGWVICCSGGSSKIVYGQIPGRASRRNDGKEISYIVDFWPAWDVDENPTGKSTSGPLLRMAEKRRRIYQKIGFNQVDYNSIEDLPYAKETVENCAEL